MELTPYILPLADDEGLAGLIRIAVVVLFLVIGAIAALVGKLKEKAQRDQALRREQGYEQDSRRREPPQQQRAQASPAEEQVRAQQVIAQLFGIPQAEPAPPPPPPPPPQAKAVPARLGEGVEEEVVRLKHGLAAEEVERHRRLDRLADHAGPGRGGDRRGTRPAATVAVDLSARDEARKAIVYAEVLGRPKGLRTDPEPWDQ